MTQQTYLLELVESAGDDDFSTKHLIEAEDRQMVKYHFHRTLKDWGYTDTPFDKHCLASHSRGLQAEIYNIKRLDPIEVQVLEKYIPNWIKV